MSKKGVALARWSLAVDELVRLFPALPPLPTGIALHGQPAGAARPACGGGVPGVGAIRGPRPSVSTLTADTAPGTNAAESSLFGWRRPREPPFRKTLLAWHAARGARRMAPMATTLECVDSTLASGALLEELRRAYDIGGAATCELIQRQLDAVYLVSGHAVSGHAPRLIARLYNARWWSRAQVEGEISVLRHLEARSVRVAAPVKRRDGAWLTTILAPEGERQLLVYHYLEGEALLPSRDAGRFGELVGRMHHALADCRLEQPRRELTFRRLTEDTFDTIVAQLGESHALRTYLEGLRGRVRARALELGMQSFRVGLCHGDLNFANAVRQPDGELGLYDFETCGAGMLAYDLATFRWTQQLLGAPEQTWLDFIDGYRRCNELPEPELAGMELLVLTRQLWMIEHDARRSQIESLGTRWRRTRRTARIDALRSLDAQVFGTPLEQGW